MTTEERAGPARSSIRSRRAGLAVCSAVVLLGCASFAVASSLADDSQTAAGETPSPATAEPPPQQSSDSDAPEKLADVAPPAEARLPLDGVDNEELDFARHLVAGSPDYAGTTDVFGEPGAQFVVGVLDTGIDDGRRRLELSYFDYTAPAVLVFAVDMTAQTVESVDRRGPSLAIAPAEAAVAAETLLASEHGGRIRLEFEDVTGKPLTSLDQLVIDGLPFVPGPADIGAEACATNRCTELWLMVEGVGLLDTERLVVDLSTKTVHEFK